MFRVVLILVFFGSCLVPVFGQEEAIEDAKYLEDQFYAGVAYNFLLDLPEQAVLRNFSYAIQLGFIKDIPINKSRNFGFGLGFGYGVNSYYSNIRATETNGSIAYDIVTDANLDRSKFETHAIELPFEIRWRNSNASEYKFWRIYSGVKAAYLFSRKSKFVASNATLESSGFQNSDIARWQYGLTLNFGYNTWNIQLYYPLNTLLQDAQLSGADIQIKPLTVGLIFYIL